ncbi:sulfite exporter TauE/SafE family protein [Ancylothrix sp. C2]|uniref:sulfite exporter TauE/SafE family protein n=1 Tax=Ancylothrix sp. D3o TaxID=2953691 RepID=UPI0021BAD955|nr:sulfite exporter TauE/SafE family protein [Ancylothrix sp. D3o]MCT7948736.1 sulfite exporter TauE/SafE family protein [Ancylothrix sp. D3o]
MHIEPVTLGLLLLLGGFTGFLSGILGVSGGFLMVPALTLMGVPVVKAAATSLVSIFLSVSSASIRTWLRGDFNFRASWQLALLGIPAAQLGAFLAGLLPDSLLSGGYAIMLLVTIYLMNLRQSLSEKFKAEESVSDEVESGKGWEFAKIGLAAGLMSGLFGIGGGIVIVPMEIIFIGVPLPLAVSHSLGAMVAISASGLTQHALNAHVLWLPGFCLGAGGILGSQIGSRLLHKWPANVLNKFLQVLLLALAVYMTGRCFWGYLV